MFKLTRKWCRMWTNADSRQIQVEPSANDSWTRAQDQFKPIWYEGPQYPPRLDLTNASNINEEEEERHDYND